MNAECVLADLDRCEHGRHEGDRCYGCPGDVSTGNPFIAAGQLIGYGLGGVPIHMPSREHKHRPENWYVHG